MKIFVTAKPNAKEQEVEKISETHFAVAVKEAPINGMANEAIAKTLAEYFKVARSRVRLVSGFSFKQKVFEII